MVQVAARRPVWRLSAIVPLFSVGLIVLQCILMAFSGNLSSNLPKMSMVDQAFPDRTHILALVRNHILCQNNNDYFWKLLCESNLFRHMDERLFRPSPENHVHIHQIGAHTGFEENDPLAKGLLDYLNLLSKEEQSRVHWYFVEPSPTNFNELREKLTKQPQKCDMVPVNVAVIPDGMGSTKDIPFYAISNSINPETGYDSKSGKMLPFYISQVGSFSKKQVLQERNAFTKMGLDMEDYIVETKVQGEPAMHLFAKTMQSSCGHGCRTYAPSLVLIDTEGFDCKIIEGIAVNSPYWPQFLVYEHKHCGEEGKKAAQEKLQKIGYQLTAVSKENTLAVKKTTGY